MINNEENNEQQISIELTEEMATGSFFHCFGRRNE